MNIALCIAGGLCLILGFVHSFLGERMIFQPAKRNTDHSVLNRFRGILWATWHLVTFFGSCLGVYLLERGGVIFPGDFTAYVVWAMLSGAVLVILGTRAKHPGWIVLLLIAVLTWIAG